MKPRSGLGQGGAGSGWYRQLGSSGFSAKASPFDWEAGSHPVVLRNVTGL